MGDYDMKVSKGSTTTICAKCAQNVKHYGKPTACEYCSILAAFIGKRCQRCVNSEKKWGPPLVCEQCKLKCAFDRSEEGRRKVDGKVLCWLCTQAYKRVLAKTRKSQDFTVGLKHSSSLREGQPGESLETRINLLTSQSESSDNKSGLAAVIMQLASSNTKPKLEKSVSNGVAVSTPKSTGSNVSDAGVVDTGTSDNVILITQLREQIESLKKQISAKDAQLLEKDKKITELKAEHYEAEKDARLKVQNLQKQHEETINNLQIKNRELQRQVTKLSKGVKKSVLESMSGSS
ncbi:hypothetical protein C0Q70_11747 [Pomacea canaliculata]|uniref:Protein FAM76A n=1 Tax=Pomacea canaliculata TaxID=400727 RepID=A0A2T7P6V0_POMCA|nr:hypothetical protein C0Q70_11747 [Pomacea canaliculata]